MKTTRFLLAIAVLSLAGTGAAYFFLPDTIPMHWNFEGEVDSWGPRWSILILGCLPLGVALLMAWLPRIDPRRDAYEKHAKTYEILQVILVLVMTGLVWITVAAALGSTMDVSLAIRILIGILFIIMGNYLGRLKRNYFVGIKTPWALADDEVWRLTHRRGAVVFMIMGASFLLSLAFRPGWIVGAVTLVPTILGVSYVFLYSWQCWKRLHGDAKPRVPAAPDSAEGKK
ncbi:MAG: DUF1648 domain-containing protein [Treponema sp.]|nr:DUF1648 domain-containing protein [Treponema sp.]